MSVDYKILPIANQGFFCDYVKDLNQSEFIDYVRNIKWLNDDYLFLAISSNEDPFEVCIARVPPTPYVVDAPLV